MIFEEETDHGQYMFSVDQPGRYSVCFKNEYSVPQKVSFSELGDNAPSSGNGKR